MSIVLLCHSHLDELNGTEIVSSIISIPHNLANVAGSNVNSNSS